MKRVPSFLTKLGLAAPVLAACLLAPALAAASVKLEGDWPDADKPISIDASNLPRSEAVRKVADAAGWSVVVHAPAGDPIDLHLKNQPAGKVLDLVLDDASYVAKRDGTLVNIQRDTSAPADTASVAPATSAPAATASVTPPAPPPAVASDTPPTPPAIASATSDSANDTATVTVHGEDRTVTGGHLQIEKGETAKDVTVLGGSVDVLGDVTGDLTVLGGSARVHDGAKVNGDATAIGGTLDIDDGAEVDGDVGVIGGVLNRAPGAKIHGEVVHKKDVKINLTDRSDEPGKSPGFHVHQTMTSIGGALTRSAILFVFGAVLLALATDRIERLRAEIAARPMRSFALGLLGTMAAGLTIVVLCITLIGIPIAVVGSIFGVFAAYAGFCAALATGGQALFGHKTQNPYMHLALGCLLFMIVGAIPVIGTWVTFILAFIGIGALVATRGAGLVKSRPRTA